MPTSPTQEEKKPVNLLRSSTTVGSMTLISRASGFIRDMVFARIFGAGLATDAFFVAFKIPNFLRRLFAEGAFSQAFVPVLAEYKEKNSQELQPFINHTAGTLCGVLLIISTIGIIASPIIVLIFAYGFYTDNDPTRYQLASDMLKITFPYLFFISLTALSAGILNSHGRFAVPAFTPVFLNISLIACAIYLSPNMSDPIVALAWGVFIAGIAQLAFQIPFLAKLKLLPKPRWGWRYPGVQKIIKLMLPAIFGAAVVQINLLLDTVIASYLAKGSVSWLYYSDRLVEFPLGVFGIALATVILPNLSKNHANRSMQAFSNTLDWALRLTFVIGLPAMLGLAILSAPILTCLFQYGAFSSQDVHMASISLVAYALGLPAFILIKVLTPGFFSRQDTKTPVRIGLIAMLINILLNIVFVLTMLRLEFNAPHAGLALATSCSAWIQAFMLNRLLRKQQVYQPNTGWVQLLMKTCLALIAMAALLFYLQAPIDNWNNWLAWQRIIALLKLILSGALIYFIVLWISGLRMTDLREQTHKNHD